MNRSVAVVALALSALAFPATASACIGRPPPLCALLSADGALASDCEDTDLWPPIEGSVAVLQGPAKYYQNGQEYWGGLPLVADLVPDLSGDSCAGVSRGSVYIRRDTVFLFWLPKFLAIQAVEFFDAANDLGAQVLFWPTIDVPVGGALTFVAVTVVAWSRLGFWRAALWAAVFLGECALLRLAAFPWSLGVFHLRGVLDVASGLSAICLSILFARALRRGRHPGSGQ